MSLLGGRPDEISTKTDISARMSDLGVKAEVAAYPQERPLLAEAVEKVGY
jgi:hypothetical protein